MIEEEYRVSYNIDKTRTYGKAILGVTIECAQCHDHKYDPITQKDYYQLYAFFNNFGGAAESRTRVPMEGLYDAATLLVLRQCLCRYLVHHNDWCLISRYTISKE